MHGPTGVKFCTVVSTRPNFIIPVQNFEGAHPEKISGAKNMQNLARFRTTLKFGGDEDFQNRIFIPSTTIPPALGETTVKFGPVTLEISMLNRTHPKCIFRKTIFRHLGGAALPNFYTR